MENEVSVCSCHSHSHSHSHSKGSEKKHFVINLTRILLASLLTGLSFIKFIDNSFDYIELTLTLIAYLIIGYDTVINMVKGWIKKEFFDENFLMILATVGAFVIGEYQEACLVLILYHIGSMLEEYASNKADKSIKNLIKDLPSVVHRYKNKDEYEDVDPELIKVGDILLIQPGERISIDGRLMSNLAEIDQSSLTGESLPVTKKTGEFVYSGSINLNTSIMIEATKEYKNSTITEIMHSILDEKNKKSKQEHFISRFSKIYTPIVCLISIVVFVTLYGINGFTNYQVPLYNALNILIIACPCSLVISIPLAFFMGMGRASKLGVLVKGSQALENLSRSNIYCFDKTGTITKGEFKLVNYSEISNEVLEIAYTLEKEISHPLAKAYVEEARRRNINPLSVEDFKNHPGFGISGVIKNERYYIGSKKFLNEFNLNGDIINTPYLVNYLFKENEVIGYFVLSDVIKESSVNAIAELKSSGAKTIMLSGDSENICKEVNSEVKFDYYHSSLLPEEKKDLVKKYKGKKGIVAFVGDGINDSLALSSADLGISMGGLGSDAAIYSSDVVVMNDDLNKIVGSRKLSKRVLMLIYENIVFILLFKITIMVLAAFSISNMILSIASDVGVMVLAVLNALRISLFKFTSKKKKSI